MTEKTIVRHCSPTIAGIKMGNLFAVATDDMDSIHQQIESWNRVLPARGMRMRLLKTEPHRALIYTYRPDLLRRALETSDIMFFLSHYGYREFEIDACLAHLEARLAMEPCFPHEIGIFLGYPLHDVEGFIRHCGKNCQCVGFWKVYGCADDALALFNRYRKCTQAFLKRVNEGKPVLPVASI